MQPSIYTNHSTPKKLHRVVTDLGKLHNLKLDFHSTLAPWKPIQDGIEGHSYVAHVA